MNKKNKNKGFSLIELIIAIAILVILTGLLAPQFMKYIEKSREAKDIHAMDTVYSSVQAALGNEQAYDEMIKETDKDASNNIYATSLSALQDEEESTDLPMFKAEMKSLVGADAKLISKKATAVGEICVAIQYVEGEDVTIGGESISMPGGFNVMVYCGNPSGERIPGLETIGSTINVGVVSAD